MHFQSFSVETHTIFSSPLLHFSFSLHTWLGTIEMPKEDHGILIISVAAVVSFLTCLLCTLCHRKRKRRHHRQLHRNAHYDSTTSATGKEMRFYERTLSQISQRISLKNLNFLIFLQPFAEEMNQKSNLFQVSTRAGAICKVVYQEVFMASALDLWEFHQPHLHPQRSHLLTFA